MGRFWLALFWNRNSARKVEAGKTPPTHRYLTWDDGSRSETKLNQPSRFLPGKNKLISIRCLEQPARLKYVLKRMQKLADIKTENTTNCHMAGGFRLGLTSQTIGATPYQSDRISAGNPARPHTSDRQTV